MIALFKHPTDCHCSKCDTVAYEQHVRELHAWFDATDVTSDYGLPPEARTSRPQAGGGRGTSTGWTPDTDSDDECLEKALTWLRGLPEKVTVEQVSRRPARAAQIYLDRYQGDFSFLVDLKSRGRSLSPAQAKGVLNCMRAEARKAATPTSSSPRPDVPEGHYAVTSRTGNNDLDFYRVDRPTEGRWAGYTFVKRVIGGHPDSPVRGSEATAALEAIVAAGAKEAAQLYGQEVGRCSRCNRHLTDETSREAGMGPECRSKS